jgi:hypothetical protein
MPKEVIHGDRSFPAYGTPEAPEAWTVVEVGWSREAEYVQLASKCIDAVDGSDFHPKLEAIEVPLRHDFEVEPMLLEAEGLRPSGQYIQMNRYAINELIRVLRRARDQAFGRDE